MNLDKTKIRIKDKEHYELVQDALYDKEIYWSSQRNKDTYKVDYDYLFIVKCDMISIDILHEMKSTFKNAKFCLLKLSFCMILVT
jgi:hypothetical protein